MVFLSIPLGYMIKFYKKKSGFKQLNFLKNNEKYIITVILDNRGDMKFALMIFFKKIV